MSLASIKVESPSMKSGFVAVVGRPNVGKSTLINALCGHKVSIVSDKPQTTRHRIMGVMNRADSQLIFVDTPGLHKPVTALGERVNATALESLADVDVACIVVDATKKVGSGDEWVAKHLNLSESVVIVNKIDRVRPEELMAQLQLVSAWGASAYFPVSARTGEGTQALLEHLLGRLPEGPAYFPTDAVSDVPEEMWVAGLVREQLLAVMRDEVPYSIATRVSEWEWPRIKVEIIVERDSQKGLVIGHKGEVLKMVGQRVREQLPDGAFIELFVKVDKDWQRHPERIERLGY